MKKASVTAVCMLPLKLMSRCPVDPLGTALSRRMVYTGFFRSLSARRMPSFRTSLLWVEAGYENVWFGDVEDGIEVMFSSF